MFGYYNFMRINFQVNKISNITTESNVKSKPKFYSLRKKNLNKKKDIANSFERAMSLIFIQGWFSFDSFLFQKKRIENP